MGDFKCGEHCRTRESIATHRQHRSYGAARHERAQPHSRRALRPIASTTATPNYWYFVVTKTNAIFVVFRGNVLLCHLTRFAASKQSLPARKRTCTATTLGASARALPLRNVARGQDIRGLVHPQCLLLILHKRTEHHMSKRLTTTIESKT